MSRRANSGFTVGDLSAVVAMISLCSLLFVPRLGRSRSCAENLHQLGRATLLYAIDNADRLPGCQHAEPSWVQGLADYCNTNAFVCPAANASSPAFTVALNDFLTPRPFGAPRMDFSRVAAIPAPEETLLFGEAREDYLRLKFDHFHFAEARENGFTPARFQGQVAVQRHGAGANYLFVDGHVEVLSWSEAQEKLTSETSRFVHPAGASGTTYARAREEIIVARQDGLSR